MPASFYPKAPECCRTGDSGLGRGRTLAAARGRRSEDGGRVRPRGCWDCGGPSGKMAAVRPGEAGGAMRSPGQCGHAVTMRGCLGWLCNSSDCHLVIPEPGGLSPLVQISARELESRRGGDVFRLGVGAFRVFRRLS